MPSRESASRGGQALARERDLHDHVLVQRGQRAALLDHAGGVVGDHLGAHRAADEVADAAHDVARVALLLGEQRGVRGGAGEDAPGGDLLHLGDRPGVYEEPHVPVPSRLLAGDARELSAGCGAGRAPTASSTTSSTRRSVGSRPCPTSITGMPAASARSDQVVLRGPDPVERLQVALRRPQRLQRPARGSAPVRLGIADGDQRPHRRRPLAAVPGSGGRAAGARPRAPSASGPRSPARPARRCPGRCRGPGAGSRATVPASSSRQRRTRARATSKEEWCTEGRNSCEKNARTTWRTWSVAITCANPSRPASCVATVDLPTPVTPPSSTTQRPLQVAHVPPLAKARQHLLGSPPPTTTSSATRAQLLDLDLAGAARRRAGPRSAARARTSAPAPAPWPSATAPSGPSSRAARSRCGRRTTGGAARSGAHRRRARPGVVRSRSRRSSSDGSPATATRAGCAGTRPRARPAPRASATISTAAAFSSVRKTSHPSRSASSTSRSRSRAAGEVRGPARAAPPRAGQAPRAGRPLRPAARS